MLSMLTSVSFVKFVKFMAAWTIASLPLGLVVGKMLDRSKRENALIEGKRTQHSPASCQAINDQQLTSKAS